MGRFPLVSVGAELAGIEASAADAASRLVLAPRDGDQPESTRSTLNNDGTPLQVCLSGSSVRRTVRLLGDPTGLMDEESYADGNRRFERARKAARDLLDATQCAALGPLCSQILDLLLPATADEMARLAGPLWLAAGLRCPGAAVYVNARHGTIDDQWTRVAECLRATLPGESALRSIDALRRAGQPASVGLEGTGLEDARIKVYWRLRRAASLTDLGSALLVDPALMNFLDWILRRPSIPASGLVFALGFGVVDGQVRDAKVDVCGHCLQLSVLEWREAIDEITVAHGLAELGSGLVPRSGAVDVAFLGYGVDAHGQRRLNLYLKDAPS